MGIISLCEEFTATLSRRSDPSPFADKGAIAEQRRLDRQYIVPRHVLRGIYPLEQDVEESPEGPGIFRSPNRPTRAGSVDLNSFGAVAKWVSALVMPPPGLAAAR